MAEINFDINKYMESDELEKKLKTYCNYLSCISQLCEGNSNGFRGIVNSKDYRNLKEKNSLNDNKRIEQLLKNSWITESHIYLSNKYVGESYVSPWLFVQMYYAIYSKIQAFSYAMGVNQSTGGTHQSSLKFISNQIKVKSDMFAYPFKVLCCGDPKNPEPLHLPDGVEINHSDSALSPSSSAWSIYVKSLKTTRNRICEHKLLEAKSQAGKKRANKKFKESIYKKIQPTSFFHFLYRLRIKTNYEDVEEFMFNLDDAKIEDFKRDINIITDTSSLQIEILVAKCLGVNNYFTLVENFLKNAKGLDANVLENRVKEMKSLYK